MENTEYQVIWDVDVSAESPEQAAQMAFEMMKDPHSTATYFEVRKEGEGDPEEIDLEEYAFDWSQSRAEKPLGEVLSEIINQDGDDVSDGEVIDQIVAELKKRNIYKERK